MRVLVCGGRAYGVDRSREFDAEAAKQRTLLSDVLTMVCAPSDRQGTIIHGAANGADTYAGAWADHWGWDLVRFPAEWGRYGKLAGPRRNALMLEEGQPDLVIAFPGGRGTANMVELARKAGVPVLRVEP